MGGIRLYELDEMFREAMEHAEANIGEDGTISGDWAEFLDEIEMERSTKRINVALVAREKGAEADTIGKEISRLQARKKATDNAKERLRQWLVDSMQPGEKEKDHRASVSCCEKESFVYNDDMIPEAYMKIQKTPRKTDLKQLYKSGVHIPGVAVTTKKTVTIR